MRILTEYEEGETTSAKIHFWFEVLTDHCGYIKTAGEWAKLHQLSEVHERFGDWVVTLFGLETWLLTTPLRPAVSGKARVATPGSTTWRRSFGSICPDFCAAIEEPREHYVG